MHIRNQDIAKEIRFAGTLHRFFLPRLRRWNYRFLHMISRWFMPPWINQKTSRRSLRIPIEDGRVIKAFLYLPKKPASGSMTGLFLIHGGGYCIGSCAELAPYIQKMTKRSDAVVFAPIYRKAYAHPYPAALEDCHLALRYFYEHAEEYGVNPKQLFVMGVSAGGGLTAALTLYERDHQGVPIAAQFPIYPMLDDRFTPSSKDNDAPVWNTPSNIDAWKTYLGPLYEKDVPIYAAPARAEDLSNLPPAWTYVGTIGPFHDEVTDYFRRLIEAGVEAHCKTFEGCFHGFDTMVPNSPQSKEAFAYLEEAFEFAQRNYLSK